MLFHTWEFLIFFLLAYLVYLPLRSTRYYTHWLLFASYVFYGWWNPLYLLLIAYSTALDYYAVKFMEKSNRRKFWLWVSIGNNLFLLGFFKYAGFITENLNYLLSSCGLSNAIPAPDILLPVGISFFTFQSMSYTIDFYRCKIKREESFIRFAAFVSVFPQLVAGPIERARNLLGQMYGKPEVTRTHVTDGLSLFLLGLFKKVAVADYLGTYVDRVFAAPSVHGSPALTLATFAFGWQIYCDFSGYTDMARGVARMMGFRLMLNFRNPYLATGLGDFWARWHISLSTWFKDYVYIPLGGNRHGNSSTYRNMFLTMVVSGLWHGAAWTFIIWGVLHAIGRVLTRELEGSAFYKDKVPKFLKQMMVFCFVSLTWIFFRAQSIGDALLIVKRIFTFEMSDPKFPLLGLALCLSMWAYQFTFESRFKWVLESAPVRIGGAVLMLLYLLVFTSATHSAFIYFQF